MRTLTVTNQPIPVSQDFSTILTLIQSAKAKIAHAVNTEVIDLYWNIGKYVSEKAHNGGWGKSVVQDLAASIAAQFPNAKGFSASNIWRMKQFYETYKDDEILAPLVRELSWTNNLLIMARTEVGKEREYYIRLCIKERYHKREHDRQITAMRYERASIEDLNTQNLPSVQQVRGEFLDSYTLDILNLPEKYPEVSLRKAIIANMRKFILEIGKDFTFVGEEYPVQVGKSDYYIDLLFYHRGLSCLVAFELKIGEFRPEYMGKMNFYLEALDRQNKKPNENPSVGVILCADKDDEVVEYALSRNISPVLVAEYTTKLPNKKLLQNKLRELTDLADEETDT
jgi:predicted nuclease of restriction endonuclease-like (RecB) superfamily